VLARTDPPRGTAPFVAGILTACLLAGCATRPTMTTQPISVPGIQAFDPADIDSVQAAFTKAPQFHFAQNWAEQTPPDLRNGTVRIGWQDDRLVYFADLDDRDIFTKATGRNQDLWKLGDVLEIFAGLHGRTGYIEYHTAPNGSILQLFWPDADALASVGRTAHLDDFKRSDPTSDARVFKRKGGWQVVGWVTAEAMGLPPGTRLENRTLDLNFGRYDATHDGTPPVLSSTSPLTKPAYHRRHEWTRIRLVPGLELPSESRN
jgi:hypothetical protein